MVKNIKLALLGGDLRQLSVAKVLSQSGFQVSLWGFDETLCPKGRGYDVCENWGEAVSGCQALILPLPVSCDGVRINCPLSRSESEIKLARVLDILPRDTLILGGRFSPQIKRTIEDKGLLAIDYYEREELQIKNAVPTAEGALALAMNQLPVTLSGAKVAVVGYGRIGKVLSQKLKLLNADVYVAARKQVDLALVESAGMNAVPIYIREGRNSLEALLDGYDVIFNTVPAWVIDESIVKRLPKETLIIDLASAPGGVDIRAAKEYGITVLPAQSLPGKYSPQTAGEIIAQTITCILEEEGIGR